MYWEIFHNMDHANCSHVSMYILHGICTDEQERTAADDDDDNEDDVDWFVFLCCNFRV